MPLIMLVLARYNENIVRESQDQQYLCKCLT